MRWLSKNTFSGLLLFLFFCLLWPLSGSCEGTKELNSNSIQSTELYLCNDFAGHCSSGAGLRSQFATYTDTESAGDLERLYFVTLNANEVVYLGFKGSTFSAPARKIVYRIMNLAGAIQGTEQSLPTSGTGYISTFSQALNGPNQLGTTNGYDAIVFTPPVPGTYYIEFSVRYTSNNNIFIGDFNLLLFDLTVGNTITHLAKRGRLYSKSWQFYETSEFYSKNYIISDDSIVTSVQFTGVQGGHWIQYCNQTGCGNLPADWITNRKSLYNAQALFPQYKIFLNEPDPVLFPPATTLGQFVAPVPYGVQNCQTGHIVFHVAVNKAGNAEITLTFPSPYQPRTLNQAVIPGDNTFDWDGLDGTNPTKLTVPNNTPIQFTVKYINGLTNLPLYDVEGNTNGFTIALVSPTGTTPAVFWDDTNIPGGANNSALPGCTSPPGCHSWASTSGTGFGDKNTVNTWWYTVSTSSAPAWIVEFRGSQALEFLQQPPQTFCANTSGHLFSVTPDPLTEVYHWSYSPPAGVTINPASSANPNVTVSFGAGASSGLLQVYGSNANCPAGGPVSSIAVTINPLPVPVISGSQSVCVNTSGHVYTTQTGMTGYTWSVSPGGTITAGSGTNAITVTWSTTGVKTVSVNYTSENSCTATTPTGYYVNVVALPVPTIAGPASVCVNSAGITYTTQTGMTGYTWTVSAGGTITAGGGTRTITVTWNTTGAKTVTVNYTNTGNCTAAAPATFDVTVNALPAPTIAGPASVCVNSTGNAYTTQTGMTGYTWTVSAGGTITAGGGTSSIMVTWSTAGAKTVMVNYLNSANCTATTPATYLVTVIALPEPTISGPASVCVNSTGNIYTTQSGMTGYTWTVSAGGTITAGSATSAITVTWSTAGAKTVTVNYANATSCTAAAPATYPVTVISLPAPTISGPASVCINSTGNAYTTQSGMSGYTWTVSSGGTITGGSSTNTIIVAWNTPGAKTVTVNYTNAGNCTAAAPASYTVMVNTLPAPSISGPATVCSNSSGNIYTTQAGMTGYVWTVSAGGIIIAGAGTSAITVTWITAGSNTVTVNYSNAGNCTAAIPASYTVTVNAQPAPAITGPASVCLNSAGNVYTTETGMANYIWTVSAGGTITAGTGTSAITVSWGTTGANTVSVNYSNANSCSATIPASYPVTVNTLLEPSVTGPESVCRNMPGITYTTEAGMTDYSWIISSGGTITAGGTSTSNFATVTWNTAGAQTISASYTDPTTSCAVAEPTVVDVTVNALPVPTFLSGLVSVCKGVSGYVYATQPGKMNYSWAVTGGTITAGGTSTSDTAMVTWDIVGPQSITISYSDPVTLCTASSPTPFLITVKPLPVPTISGPGEGCLNTAGPLYFTESGMSYYLWSVPGGTIIPGLTPDTIHVVWNTLGPHILTISYTGVNGCVPEAATQKPVLVNPLPVPGLSGQHTICTGTQTTYSTEPGMQDYVWSLSPGGTIISGGSSADHTVIVTWSEPGEQQVYVNYTLGTGCTAAAPANFTVTVNQPTPPVIQQSPAGHVCVESTVTYSTQPGMTGYSWAISPGGVITATPDAYAIHVTWNTVGPQWVSANFTNSDMCTTATPARFDVPVNYLPVTSITAGPGPECESMPHAFMNPADTGCIFNWTINPGSRGLVISGQGSEAAVIEWNSYGPAVISVSGTNKISGCATSADFGTTILPKPNPVFMPCFDVVTTPNARKFSLRGASPFLPGQGVFSGDRVSLNSLTHLYEFNPTGAAPGVYPVTYTYTNTFGCRASPASVSILVQNNLFLCGDSLTDVRDGKKYNTSLIDGKCWMTDNLAFGTVIAANEPSTDNCINEKYCPPGDADCENYGGLYQWDELMKYGSTTANQGICPPAGSFIRDPYLSGGFHALLKGLIYHNSRWAFTSGNLSGAMFWTSTPDGNSSAIARGVNDINQSTSRYAGSFSNAFSLRCVKDQLAP
ncbi:MAG: hypothetical protein NTW16_20000 [Bacteroidetes bacterium]|nr:hypothetical protein [Bacteroidota bacterium]